jgi:hypothetical protein
LRRLSFGAVGSCTVPLPPIPAFPLPRFSAVLPRLADNGHGLGYRDGRARFDDVLQQRAAGPGNQLHHGLVGLDFGKHIAYGDRLTLLLLPLDEASLLHGWREGLHDNLCGHS